MLPAGIEEAIGCVMGSEQRLDLTPEVSVPGAGFVQERDAGGRRTLQRCRKDLLDSFPLITGHRGPQPSLNSRLSHALAIAHSRLTVARRDT